MPGSIRSPARSRRPTPMPASSISRRSARSTSPGPDAARFLDRVCANAMDRRPGRAIYTAMLNTRGGIESDLTAVRLADNHYRLYVGTTARRRDLAWLRRHVDDHRVELYDRTEDFTVIGLMGPDAAEHCRCTRCRRSQCPRLFRRHRDHDRRLRSLRRPPVLRRRGRLGDHLPRRGRRHALRRHLRSRGASSWPLRANRHAHRKALSRLRPRPRHRRLAAAGGSGLRRRLGQRLHRPRRAAAPARRRGGQPHVLDRARRYRRGSARQRTGLSR